MLPGSARSSAVLISPFENLESDSSLAITFSVVWYLSFQSKFWAYRGPRSKFQIWWRSSASGKCPKLRRFDISILESRVIGSLVITLSVVWYLLFHSGFWAHLGPKCLRHLYLRDLNSSFGGTPMPLCSARSSAVLISPFENLESDG